MTVNVLVLYGKKHDAIVLMGLDLGKRPRGSVDLMEAQSTELDPILELSLPNFVGSLVISLPKKRKVERPIGSKNKPKKEDIHTLGSYKLMEENQMIHGGVGLKEEFLDKSLYLGSVESITFGDKLKLAYVIRSINLRELLMPPSSMVEKIARQVACMTGEDLPICGGCGVLGSKIFFAGGFAPNRMLFGACNSVYVFDIHDPNQEIFMMPQTLKGGKERPLMVEFAGKLYVLSCTPRRYNFEVFDPDRATWLALPPYPKPFRGCPSSYALAGIKLFVSNLDNCSWSRNKERPPQNVWCFDLAAQDPQKQKWKRVLTPFPLFRNGLVLDLEQNPHRKLLFTLKRVPPSVTNLLVYLMSLDEDQEDITEILEMNLPAEFPYPDEYHFFHLGGNNVCLVNSSPRDIDDDYFETSEDGSLILRGAAILFQFEFDICKVNEDMNNCITVEFQPPCGFEYHGDPGPHSPPSILGCFVL
ncbi:hypothetical protein ACLB2K_054903 [Fragaria x ananassa]